MRAACSEPGQAQSTHVHEHGNTVPPELADGDELDPVDAFAVIRRRIGLAIRVTRHNHPMPSGGLVWEVIKGSIDLSRAEAVAGFFFQLPAAGLQGRLVALDPAPRQYEQGSFGGLLILPDKNHLAVPDRHQQNVLSANPDVVPA